MTKTSMLLAALASAFATTTINAAVMPMITSAPSFVLFKSFTDYSWGYHVGSYGNTTFDAPTYNYTDAINAEGWPCEKLKPLAGHSADLLDTVTVNPAYPYIVSFWYEGIVAINEGFTITANGASSLPFYATTTWQEGTIYVPATNSISVRFLFVQTTGAGFVNIDAVSALPIIPSPWHVDTNFTATLAPGGVTLAWTYAMYSNYTLTASALPTGPFTAVAATLATNAGQVTAFQAAPNGNQFYLLKR